jgi:hypothetical protein
LPPPKEKLRIASPKGISSSGQFADEVLRDIAVAVYIGDPGSVALYVKKGPFAKASAFYPYEGDIIVRMEGCC